MLQVNRVIKGQILQNNYRKMVIIMVVFLVFFCKIPWSNKLGAKT